MLIRFRLFITKRSLRLWRHTGPEWVPVLPMFGLCVEFLRIKIIFIEWITRWIIENRFFRASRPSKTWGSRSHLEGLKVLWCILQPMFPREHLLQTVCWNWHEVLDEKWLIFIIWCGNGRLSADKKTQFLSRKGINKMLLALPSGHGFDAEQFCGRMICFCT